MAKKSRRAKAKYHARAKYRARSTKEVEAIQQQPLQASVAKSEAKIPLQAKDAASSHQYIGSELRRIGILAGSIIIILIVLSFILPKLG